MTTFEDFMALVRTEVGLPLTDEDAHLPFDQLPEWDSLLLVTLLSALERATGRRVSLPDVLQAACLHDIYALVAVPA
ncbi:phosphopantetheine-binding protein [Streptomyces axinellae]|uniref:Carrier domain-containing protein n=1 Tax=Streptomyces axinellae TaxID=552788 RepID=A0ABN3QXI8_9ACTN